MSGMRKRRTLRVGILAPPLPSYVRDIYRGVLHYAYRDGKWLMRAFPSSGRVLLPQSKEFTVDGLIAYIADRAMADTIRALHVPCVNISAHVEDLGFPCVWPDNAAVGRMAASHLISLGLRHFAYLGPGGTYFAEQRGDAFCDLVRAHGFECMRVDRAGDPNRTVGDIKWLIRCLGKFPLPCGVFACDDHIGANVLEACERAHLRVPEDIAVVGVNDEETLCSFTNPPLSSIPQPGYQAGYQAAVLLDRLMHGKRPPRRHLVIPVPPLKVRRSTDIIATGDPLVADTVRLIRERAPHESVTVAELAAAMRTARRTLDRRFMRVLGRSPKVEIDRVRLERLQWYLGETNLSIKRIWLEMGFSSPREPARFLRRQTGMTPTAYRMLHSRDRLEPGLAE